MCPWYLKEGPVKIVRIWEESVGRTDNQDGQLGKLQDAKNTEQL